uniref:Uncharacterized protein n=1 Tax=Anguilla anguilla TaxID=7936 RepID=A0A0E9XHX2_ANGAN
MYLSFYYRNRINITQLSNIPHACFLMYHILMVFKMLYTFATKKIMFNFGEMKYLNRHVFTVGDIVAFNQLLGMLLNWTNNWTRIICKVNYIVIVALIETE